MEDFARALDNATDHRAESANRVAAQKFAGAFYHATDNSAYTASYATDDVTDTTNYSTHFKSLQIPFRLKF